MENKTVREIIEEALKEANFLESALEVFNEEHMLYTAMKMSGAPYSFIEDVYSQAV